jgi:hypothetical protein
MVRVAGLRRALAACAQSVTALQQGAAGSCRPASLSSLIDSAPSTSYSAPQPGWLRRPASAAAAAAAGQAQLSGAAAAVAEERHPQAATYTVVVVTGDVRGAGSPAPAVVTLVGTGGAACDEAGAALLALARLRGVF